MNIQASALKSKYTETLATSGWDCLNKCFSQFVNKRCVQYEYMTRINVRRYSESQVKEHWIIASYPGPLVQVYLTFHGTGTDNSLASDDRTVTAITSFTYADVEDESTLNGIHAVLWMTLWLTGSEIGYFRIKRVSKCDFSTMISHLGTSQMKLLWKAPWGKTDLLQSLL